MLDKERRKTLEWVGNQGRIQKGTSPQRVSPVQNHTSVGSRIFLLRANIEGSMY